MHLSAFVLVVSHMVAEIARFVAAILLLVVGFGCGISALRHDDELFGTLPSAMLSLSTIVVGMYDPDYTEMRASNPHLLSALLLFTSMAAILLLNLLISQ